MYNALLIASFIGPLYLAVGVGLLTSPGHYEKMYKDFMKSEALIYLGGIMALLFGLIILHLHNEWHKDWRVLITLIGWLGTLKGIGLLAVPDWFLGQFKNWKVDTIIKYGGWFAVAVGAFFSYMAYLA